MTYDVMLTDAGVHFMQYWQTSIHRFQWLLESESGDFGTTLTLHSAFLSIVVVSSIAIPKMVSLLLLRFQISHN